MLLHTDMFPLGRYFGFLGCLADSWPVAKAAEKSPPLGNLFWLLPLLVPQHLINLFCIAHTLLTIPSHTPPLESTYMFGRSSLSWAWAGQEGPQYTFVELS